MSLDPHLKMDPRAFLTGRPNGIGLVKRRGQISLRSSINLVQGAVCVGENEYPPDNP